MKVLCPGLAAIVTEGAANVKLPQKAALVHDLIEVAVGAVVPD